MRSLRRLPPLLLLAAADPARAHLLGGGGDDFSWFDLDPLALSLLLLSAWLYRRGMAQLLSRPFAGGAMLRARQRCFWGGWLCLLLALASPLDALGEQLFAAHMLQHELMMLAAAPLLVLSQPASALLRGAPAWTGRTVGGLLRTAGGRRLRYLLGAPFAAWTIHLAGLWGWHLPDLFSAGLRNGWIHALQHASFLLVALVFWWALLRGPARNGAVGVLYLFTTAVHSSLLGVLLTFSPRVWYSPYLDTAPAWGLSALQDQQLGGLIMWVPAGLVFILAALLLLAAVLEEGGRGSVPGTRAGGGEEG